MKTIHNLSKELTFIIYNGSRSPKYIKMNKKIIRALILIIPVLVITLISLSLLYSIVLKNKVNELKSKEPEIITALNKQNEQLTNQLANLSKENKTLINKLSMGQTKESSFSALNLFNLPLGLKDLRAQNLLAIENLKVENSNNKTLVKFDLANNSNDKLSGYLSVVQFQGNLIQYYPEYELGVKNLRLDYSSGESFSFSRFRPTVASFKKVSSLSARFKIYIFTRTGDLIAYRQIGPYNIE